MLMLASCSDRWCTGLLNDSSFWNWLNTINTALSFNWAQISHKQDISANHYTFIHLPYCFPLNPATRPLSRSAAASVLSCWWKNVGLDVPEAFCLTNVAAFRQRCLLGLLSISFSLLPSVPWPPRPSLSLPLLIDGPICSKSARVQHRSLENTRGFSLLTATVLHNALQ